MKYLILDKSKVSFNSEILRNSTYTTHKEVRRRINNLDEFDGEPFSEISPDVYGKETKFNVVKMTYFRET